MAVNTSATWWTTPGWRPPKKAAERNPALAFGVSTLGGQASSLLTAGLDALTGPVKMLVSQGGLDDGRVVLPEPGSLMTAYLQGQLSDTLYKALMGRHGIQIGPRAEGDRDGPVSSWEHYYSHAWRAVENCATVAPDLDTVVAASLLGLWTEAEARQASMRLGLDRRLWEPIKELLYEAPGISEALSLHARGVVDFAVYDRMMRRNGARVDDWAGVMDGMEDSPSPGELQVFLNRGLITEEQFRTWLHRNSLSSGIWQNAYLETRKIIPGVGDLINFELKEAFLPALANKLGLYDEFPGFALPWVQKQGLLDGPGFVIHSDGRDKPAHWLDMYWASHWDAPASGQIFEFFQRHRPGRVERYRAQFPDIRAFDLTEAKRWLRYANIPPGIRSNFLAAAYNTLPMRTVQQGIQFGVIKRADAVEDFQDQGYSPADAERMADIAVERQREREDAPRKALVQRLIGQSVHEIVASYETGVISRALAAEKLLQVLQDRNAVDGQLGVIDNRILRGLADRALRSIRTDWMQGTLSPAELEAALLSAGIQPERVTYYVQLWTLERGHRRRAASSGQILSWVSKGLMPAEEASRRLANLNWYGPDAAVMLAESQHKLAKLQAAEEARVASTASKSAKAVAKMHKDTEALQKSLQSRLRASEPVSRLIKWIKAGIIDEPQFRKRLQAIGVVPSVIEQYIREVHAEMGTERAKAEEAATTKSRKGVRHAPVSTLRKWLKLGIINEDQFRSMAAAVKTDKDDIERYVQQTEMGK